MTLFRTTLLAAALGGTALVAIGKAQADPVDGLYVGAGAGYNLLQNLNATIDATSRASSSGASGVSTSAPMRVRWGDGYALSGSVGWGFGNGVRVEFEGSYREVFQSNGGSGGGGHESRAGVMANALYDVDVGLNWVTPYIGLGGGYQAVTWSNVSGTASGLGSGGPVSVDINGTRGGFAYQIIVGAAFPIEAVPGLSVTAEYRYMNLAGSRDYSATGTTSTGTVNRARVGEDGSHSLMIGLRYAFDMPETAPVERPPPAPPPAAVPAPAAGTTADLPARTYLVFFDWDSASLTPRAREIIAEAVRNSVHVPHTRIEVTGHADRSGTAHGNQILSLRRAKVVASELEHWGVPEASIEIHAAGDTRPLVPTSAGVRQSENRRVEIVYR